MTSRVDTVLGMNINTEEDEIGFGPESSGISNPYLQYNDGDVRASSNTGATSDKPRNKSAKRSSKDKDKSSKDSNNNVSSNATQQSSSNSSSRPKSATKRRTNGNEESSNTSNNVLRSSVNDDRTQSSNRYDEDYSSAKRK